MQQLSYIVENNHQNQYIMKKYKIGSTEILVLVALTAALMAFYFSG